MQHDKESGVSKCDDILIYLPDKWILVFDRQYKMIFHFISGVAAAPVFNASDFALTPS